MALVVGTNSYINIADAETYFGDRVFTDTWTELVGDDKGKYLVSAFNLLETSFLWYYDKTSDSQIQEFPRNEEIIVPQKIINAQCEITLLLANNKSDLVRPDKIMKYDKVMVQTANTSIFTDFIVNLVKEYGHEKGPEQVHTINVLR